jgi:hypothetical protein
MSEKLQAFIRHARAKGLDHGTIRTLLLAAGWKERDIAGGIVAEGLEMSVPEPAGKNSARDAFLYSLTFTALYLTVWAAIVLFYTYLDYLYPDPAWGEAGVDAVLDVVRYAIAAAIIAFPLFVLVTAILERTVLKDPDSQVHPVQKWFTYMTVFLAAAVTLGDVITLLFYFLDGALTTRFVLKAVVLLVIAEVVLSYYVLSPRPGKPRPAALRLRPLVAGLGALLVCGSVALGFAMAGSPVTARLRKLDEKRVEDLRAVHQALQRMVTKTDSDTKKLALDRELPKSLVEVAEYAKTKETGRKLDLEDPQTGEKYVYTVTGDKTYELSAIFSLPREKRQMLFWNHPAGQHSFKFNAESPP